MKQKMVIRVSMTCQKCRSKAMKIAVGVSGVLCVALRGQEQNDIEVVGEMIDPVVLITLLRKNVGSAALLSVSSIGSNFSFNGLAVTGEVGMVLNSVDDSALLTTFMEEDEASTLEQYSPFMEATVDFSLGDEFLSADLGSTCPDLSFSSLWTSDDFSTGPSTGTTGPQPMLVEPPPWGVNSPSMVATVDFSLGDEFWSPALGSPYADPPFSSMRTSDDFSTGPSSATTGPQPVLVEPPPWGVNSPSMVATVDFSLGDEFWSPALGSPYADLPFSSLWNSDDFSAAGPSTGTTGAPPVPVGPPTRFRLGKRTTVDVNKHVGLSETFFFVVEFNHTPQGESIHWRNVEINYPDIDNAFKEQESYVTLFERQVTVMGDAKDFSDLKKIWHGAYDLVLEVEDFLLNKRKDFLPKTKYSPDVDEGCKELEIVFGRMKLQNLRVKGISVIMCIQLKARYVMGRIDIFGHRKTQICSGRPEIAFGEGLQESPQGPQAYTNGADMQIDSSEQQLTLDFDVTCNGGNIVFTDQSDIPVTGSENNNIKMISPLLSAEFLPQLYGMKLDDAAKLLGDPLFVVSRSTLKRSCRKYGISKWPFRKQNKGRNDLPKLNCENESVRDTEGAHYQPSLTIGPINRDVGSMCWPVELRRSNLQQIESIPSAPYYVPNTPVSMQPRTFTELTGCSEFLKCLHASEQAEVVLKSTETVPPCFELPPEHRMSSTVHTMPDVTAMQAMKIFNIKATYRTDTIQFPLSSSSRKAELEDNVSQSLKLMRGKFSIKYLDTEDDWILITRDKDLHYCMHVSKQLGKRTIKMLIEDIGSV